MELVRDWAAKIPGWSQRYSQRSASVSEQRWKYSMMG